MQFLGSDIAVIPAAFTKRREKMKTFGLAITVVVGGYVTFMLLKSIPDMVRYVKISTM
jgi:hypothetical protein